VSTTAPGLHEIEIFRDLSEIERNRLKGMFREVHLSRSRTLFRQGDPGDEMFIVCSGKVSISLVLPDGKRIEVKQFGPGEFFGEMTIFEDMPRSADCTALDDTDLYGLGKEDFFHLMGNSPEVAIKIMHRMLGVTTQWLLSINTFHAEMVQWGEQARRRSITDDLTGLYNRRFLDDALEDNLSQARLKHESLVLVMVDLDRFNTINQACGQPTGDAIIQSAADVFRTVYTEPDIVARYGGDEFTVIMPGTTLEQALERAEAVRAAVEAMVIPEVDASGLQGVTTSQGVAVFPDDGNDSTALKASADKALYRAKQDGRNRVVYGS
jgi:diguanylate cyclase (GGDEF)-like protein